MRRVHARPAALSPIEYPDRPPFAVDIHLNAIRHLPRQQRESARRLRAGSNQLSYFIAGDIKYPTALDLHVHAGLEFGMVLEGEEEVHFGDTRLILGPGGVWLCAMWEPHAWQVTVPDTKTMVAIFLPEFLGTDPVGDISYLHLFALPPDRRPQAKQARLRERLLSIGQEMAREMREGRRLWQNMARLHLLRVLAELRRSCDLSLFTPGSAGSDGGHHALARVIPAVRRVQERPWERISGAEAARACALSRSHFDNLFRTTMGISFGSFCQRARVAFAAQKLLHTDQAIRQIAEDAGFVDISHFHRAFTKHYACTPGKYRSRRGPVPHARG